MPGAPQPGGAGGATGAPGGPEAPATPGGEGAKTEGGEKKEEEKKTPPNYGFSADQLPEDVKAKLDTIMPQGEPTPEGTVSMSFRNAEVADFLQFLSDHTGYTFIPHTDLAGQVTITCPMPVPVDMALRILESWLAVRGYGMSVDPGTKIVRIEPYARARTRRTGVGQGLDLTKIGDGNGYVTQVIQLTNTDAGKVKDLIAPLVDSEAAVLTASPELNAIVITDTADNVRRIVSVVAALEETETTEVQKVEVIPLEYADARVTAQLLTQLFQQTQVSQQQIQQMIQRAGGDPSKVKIPGQGLIGLKGQVKVVYDERTNALVILAAEEKLALIRDIVKEINHSTASEIEYRVFDLVHADAVQAAEVLNELFEQPRGGVSNRRSLLGGFAFAFGFGSRREGAESYGLKENVVTADIRTNQLIVTASKENMPVFEELVKELDSEKALTGLTKTYKLKNARAENVAETLSDALRGRRSFGGFLGFLFGSRNRQGTPLQQLEDIQVTAETNTNQIIVTAPPQAFALMDQLVEQLDQRVPQVFIRVLIADITLSKGEEFGVEWNWFVPNTGGTVGTTGDVGFADQPQDGIRWGFISQNIQAFISALHSRGNVEIISTPLIMTQDNVLGRIRVGRRIPVLGGESESSSGRITNSVDYEDVFIDLQVTPRVTDSGFVSMEIDQSIDDVGENTDLGNPIIIARQASTRLLVKDTQTVVLGGIISEATRKQVRRVPIIDKIPLIGPLFRSKREEVRRSELMVFLTPYIVTNEQDASEVTAGEAGKLTTPLDLDTAVPDTTRWDKPTGLDGAEEAEAFGRGETPEGGEAK